MVRININVLLFLILLNKTYIIFECEDIFKMEGKFYCLILFTCQKIYIYIYIYIYISKTKKRN